jgi:RND family efflux transporter MFP subunit
MNYERKLSADTFPAPNGTSDGMMRRRSRAVYWIVALVAIGAILAAAWFAFGRTADDAGPAETQLPAITVIAPGQTTIDGTINATGTIAARRELPVGVVGEGGRVVAVPVDAGDWVREGQVLAVIDRSVQTQQSRSAAAQISVAQADADLAQADLDRALQLVDRGFVSQAEVDRLRATRDAARARVAVARAQAAERSARNAQLNIVAPAAGLVLSRDVEPGQTVGAGSPPAFTIARGGEMELLARVSEDDLAQLSVGVPAEVRPVGTDTSLTGQVWQLAPTIDEATRQGIARIALGYDRALRPGGFATATIRAGAITAPILPESAVLSDTQGSYVYVVDDEDRVRRQPVTLGTVTAEGIAIASGLTGQERIVLRAGGFLNEGDIVRPMTQSGRPAG